jgi:CRP-like cAMP-binding protein
MRKVLYIFSQLEDRDLQWLLDAGQPRRVAAGQAIILEGAPQEELFIVVGGELSVRKAGREIARLGSGEVLGEMSLLDARPSNATLVALVPCEVFAVQHAALRAQLCADSAFAARFYRALCFFLANRLSRTDAMIGRGGRVAEELDRREDVSPDALGSVALAGARFDWFLDRVRGAGSG